MPAAVGSSSAKGISFSSLTPDGQGGVWIAGQVLYSGLLLHATPEVKAGTIPEFASIDHLFFPTAKSGWMIADGAVYSSSDLSKWNRVDVAPNGTLKRIHFLNDRIGWLYGKGGAIYRTLDGGNNWHKQNSGTDYDIRQLQFVNPLDGWAVGVRNGNEIEYKDRIFLSTSDGGDHWTAVPGSSPPITRFSFINDLEGWGIDYNGNIVHTTDRGWSWELQKKASQPSFVSIYFVDSSHGWVAGDGIMHTDDGGRTWNYQVEPRSPDGQSSFSQIYFLDSENGWALDSFGAVFTTNGGETWKPISDDWKSMVPPLETIAKDTATVLMNSSYHPGENPIAKNGITANSSSVINLVNSPQEPSSTRTFSVQKRTSESWTTCSHAILLRSLSCDMNLIRVLNLRSSSRLWQAVAK